MRLTFPAKTLKCIEQAAQIFIFDLSLNDGYGTRKYLAAVMFSFAVFAPNGRKQHKMIDPAFVQN